MIKKIFYLIVLISVLSCNEKTGNQLDMIKNNQLKYFGFVLIDTYWDDPTDSSQQINYADEVHAFSNLADILVVEPTDDIVSRVLYMDSLSMKVVLHLQSIFFEVVGSGGNTGVIYGLRVDYQQRWNQFIQLNAAVMYDNFIQAFYVGEEPFWNGITFQEFKAATDYVKQTKPNIPIMMIEAYPILDSIQIPTSIDWVGFDHYFIKNPNTDSNYQREMKTLKSKLSAENQKIVIIMDAHFIPAIHGNAVGLTISDMGEVAKNYYQLALNEPKAIALIGYFWPNGFDFPDAIGGRGMPESVKKEYVKMGKEISGK